MKLICFFRFFQTFGSGILIQENETNCFLGLLFGVKSQLILIMHVLLSLVSSIILRAVPMGGESGLLPWVLCFGGLCGARWGSSGAELGGVVAPYPVACQQPPSPTPLSFFRSGIGAGVGPRMG